VGPIPVKIPAALPAGLYGLEAILAQPVRSAGGEEMIFQPYENPEIEGYKVSEITVTVD